jgi:cytochrome c-type biogenesis protein CcmF
MASLGYYLLLAAFVVGAYAAAVSVGGARRRSRALTESGIGAFHLITAIMLVASAVIVYAFVTGDYSIKYVHRVSDSAQPLFYKITAYWGGLEGSIMYWVTLLAAFGSAAVYINRERHRELIPYVVAVIAVVEMFFIFVMIVHNNPFQTFLTQTPADGQGLSPLLQNFYMVIHPPTMYLGFVGLTIPFAFGMAALITGYLDDSWLRAVRRWTMVAWLFLTIGLGLGMIWAYEELGWGGYWMWDPVENAGLLPWFTATAFLHSVMVQERRGMLRVWNVSLVITTFFLTLFGTFMTRSGVVQSIHAFGEDPELARLFTGFMILTLVFSFGFVIYRLPLLRARNELDSWLSREAAFLVNNWILLFCAFFVLFATMFPTLTEAVTEQRITVSAPFFNRWLVPIGLVMLLLTGIGPLLAWRKSTLINLRDQFLFPTLTGLVVGGAVVALGVPFWSSGVCFGFAGLVMGTIVQEFWRGARVRQETTGTDIFTALIGLVGRNKRRYGGYIVHVGVVLLFLGFAGSGFKQIETVSLKPTQTVTVGDYTVRFDGMKVTDDGQKQMVTGTMTVLRDGAELTKMYPARWFFRKHENDPTTEVAIRRSFAEDLYVVLARYDVAQQSAEVEVVVNPLVNWVWFGFGVLALGTLIALLPDSVFAFAVARVPAHAATATLLLLALALSPASAYAQHVVSPQSVPVASRTAFEREVGRALVCMCGTCGRKLAGECECGYAAQMRDEIAMLAREGKTKQQILNYYVEKYGSQEPLAEPIDEGFNRLAWMLPYVLGAAGLVTIVLTARHWTRARMAAAGAEDQTIDPALDARLDDELRNLD